jgi:hypothetical protein
VFTNLISSLTSLLPKNFIFGSYFPVIIFAFVNLLLVFIHVSSFRGLVAAQLMVPSAFSVAVAFVATIVLAYILSSMADYLRELLEGKHLLPSFLKEAMRRDQQRRYDDLREASYEASTRANTLRQRVPDWQRRLNQAEWRVARGFPVPVPAPPVAAAYDTESAAHLNIAYLIERRRSCKEIDPGVLEIAVGLLVLQLAAIDSHTNALLAADYRVLSEIVDFTQKLANAAEIDCFRRLQTFFGILQREPTSMGNIAASLNDYTGWLYGLDLVAFWSRLQPILLKNDEKSYAQLIDSKTQIDFLIACCCLTALTTAAWFVALALFGNSVVLFLIIAVVGPLTCYLLYKLAEANYISYGQIVRASVDLNRFALLRALHIALPSGLREERTLWWALQQISAFSNSNVELGYDHDAKPDVPS